MKPDPDEGYVAVEVEFPPDLFAELDTYAVTRGYHNVDAVVAEAIEQQ